MPVSDFQPVIGLEVHAQLLTKNLSERAEATSRRIAEFVADIERQISWATRASSTTIDQRRADYALLLEQVPAIERLLQLDPDGITIEYSFGMEEFAEHGPREPRLMPKGLQSIDYWGAMPDQRFGKVGAIETESSLVDK